MRLRKSGWVERGNYRKRVLAQPQEGVLVQVVQIAGGKVVGEHYHEKQMELYYILGGEARLKIGSEEYQAREGDSFLCLPEQRHSVDNRNGKEAFELLVLKLNYFGDDSVWLE